MSSYWGSFPDFDHNPSAPVKDEFQRLANLEGWMGNNGNKTEKYREEWAKCFQAEFNEHYGDPSSLAGWQTLCREFGLDVIPGSVKKCKHVSCFPYRLQVRYDLCSIIQTGLERESMGEYCRFG
jgi:hypothetical protein